MSKADWIKPGAVVIDVGVNSKPAPEDKRGYKLCGDVDPGEASLARDASPTRPRHVVP